MKQLYSARTGLEAHDIRLFLESRGIEAKVFGDNSPLEVGFSFTPASAPGVFVQEHDFESALSLLEEFWSTESIVLPRHPWTCPQCRERIDGQFDRCWKCQHERGDLVELETTESSVPLDDPIEPIVSVEPSVPTKGNEISQLSQVERNELWLEVSVVLAVAWLPYFSNSLLTYFLPNEGSEWSFVADSLSQISGFASISFVILYVIYRGATPWRVHGIRKPRVIVDIISGFTIWMAANLITTLVYGMGAMASVATEAESAIEPSYGFSLPQSGIDYLMMIVLSLCIGFSEELAMRGYLIPRFEKLLGSTTRSLFASTALFASYHLYQGFEGLVLVFFTGLVFGIAFCWSRRLWPVVIAHACADIWALGTAG